MRFETPHINLVVAWVGILLGFLSGLALGLNFQRENWLGGYGSFKRRLYRLAHISLFGLGAVNLLFYLTAKDGAAGSLLAGVASWAFIVGAVSMPVCCLLMAHFPRVRLLFAVPVLSLMLGGGLTLAALLRPPASSPEPTTRPTFIPKNSAPSPQAGGNAGAPRFLL